MTELSPAQNLQVDLARFVGSENYYLHWLKSFTYTDGVKFLADTAACYWLLDAIASYQPQCRKDPMLAEFQVWFLLQAGHAAIPWIEVAGNSAVLTCWRDTPTSPSPPSIRQDILFTDFLLPEIKLYVSCGVLMLPSEY